MFAVFGLFVKLPFNDGDSIKIRDIKDYHIFEYEMDFSFISIYSESEIVEDAERFPLKRE